MKTDYAKEIVVIAYRVLDELDAGRRVAPERIEWAQRVIVQSLEALQRPYAGVES